MNKNKRILMVEGCDRTGKSTFIDKLSDQLKCVGKIPLVFHLMGPHSFSEIDMNNDNKSLIQLSKFYDEYCLIKQMLLQDDRIVVILDRTAFGEYVWSHFWNRVGYCSGIFPEDDFRDLLEQTYYITFYLSDMKQLEQRILESENDTKIFSKDGKTVLENISEVYSLYDNLTHIISLRYPELMIKFYDNSNSIDDLNKFVQEVYNIFVYE